MHVTEQHARHASCAYWKSDKKIKNRTEGVKKRRSYTSRAEYLLDGCGLIG